MNVCNDDVKYCCKRLSLRAVCLIVAEAYPLLPHQNRLNHWSCPNKAPLDVNLNMRKQILEYYFLIANSLLQEPCLMGDQQDAGLMDLAGNL